jgi:RNA polymerase sigma factor (sigma-70 family)
MVLGVCRRVLRKEQDAEDAFQATFLVLVRRAGSIVPRELVGNWLYGVAYRTALEARRAAARRRTREKQVEDMPHPTVEPEECWRDLRPLLDRELSRLPDKYRIPVVLCDLEGRTRKEAARQLDLPEGTVSGRLTTARRILAKRLSRHGLTLSAGALAEALTHGSASAAVPTTLIAATVQAASQVTAAGAASAQVVGLTNTIVKLMALAKLKTVAGLVLLAVVLGGAVVITYHNVGGTESRPEAGPDVSPTSPPVVVLEKSDHEKLQGTWVAVSIERAGVKNNDPNLDDYQFTFAGDRVTYRTKNRKSEGPFRLDPARKPKQINLELNQEVVTQAIYELDGNRLKMCWAKPGGRPAEFDTTSDPFTILYDFEKKP